LKKTIKKLAEGGLEMLLGGEGGILTSLIYKAFFDFENSNLQFCLQFCATLPKNRLRVLDDFNATHCRVQRTMQGRFSGSIGILGARSGSHFWQGPLARCFAA
jgi:hypothetical protein